MLQVKSKTLVDGKILILEKVIPKISTVKHFEGLYILKTHEHTSYCFYHYY